MIEAVRTSETSVDNHFTRQYNPEDSSEQDTKVIVREEEKANGDVRKADPCCRKNLF
jgi:hypothetical protein